MGDLVQIERGGSPRPIDDYITDAPNGLNWVKIGDAPAQGNYITKTAEKIRPEGLSKTREVHPGDLILSNSMSFGKPYIMGIYGCIHDGWLLIRNTYNFFDLTLLCHLLGTPQMLNQYRSLAAGSTVNNLNKELVGNTVVTIPNIDEQRVLGQYFKLLDNLITLHQCKYNYLLRLKDCIFSIIAKTTWEQRKVREIADRYDNLRVPVAASIRIPGTTPYYGANGIQDYVEGYTHEGEFVLVAEDGANDLINYPVKCVNGRIWVNNHAHVIQGKDIIANNQFLAYSINHADIENLLVGGSRAKLNAETLMDIELTIPSVIEQQEIGSYLKSLDHLIALHQCKLKLLKQIKQSMKNRLFIKNTTKNRKELENMTFKYESDFEETLINLLSNKGWEKDVIKYPTESELLQNWANILFDNNRGIDRLNNYPLTEGEMQQVLEQINSLRTPIKLNEFINGKTVSIKRDNPDDLEHLGKEVSLKIYDRREIAAGQSRYQIVQQPVFPSKSIILNDRRGDLMLLINGMPVIHIELKKSGVPVSQACNQIEKYSKEGIFTGLFSLVQVFVAMTPNETRYFANPGPDGRFNSDYYFKWADFNNEPINDWKEIASSLLSIPMAHQLIGFYTIADESDGILKVMRSYQYYAANAISDKVAKIKWDESNQRGGFIWHTTGSGKTMTSFKSAQLIADSQEADKVVFLMDRIELGTQSLGEYRGFAGESKGISNEESSVKSTENTYTLISKLKSDSYLDTLIVTSIQKMSRIKDEDEGLKADDIEKINKKRIVFIVDEAHRSTFGEMLQTIKNTFPKSVFFGFTGTPIQDENEKKMSTTISVFGDELHRYSIADGIRDKNVLGFDIYKVMTFRDSDVRRSVAMERAKVKNREDINFDERKKADT